MLAARITLPHFSVSAATNAPNSAAVSTNGVMPTSPSLALALGVASAALIAQLSVSMISRGAPFDAPSPHHVLASYPGMLSPMVGTSGSVAARVAVVTANARNLPALACSIELGGCRT